MTASVRLRLLVFALVGVSLALVTQNGIWDAVGAGLIGILLILATAFGSWRLAVLVLLTLPMALTGGLLAAYLTGGVLSLGSLVGFFTVLGIAARNGILMINHCQHLQTVEGVTFGPELVMRAARERLAPNGLALTVPRTLGDVRIARGQVTLYKTTTP